MFARAFNFNAIRRGFPINRRGFAVSADSHGLIPKLASVSNLGKFKMDFPRLVVVGNQSSGKSSVLDGLMGEDILPKGDSMVTRRPIEVTLIKDSSRWGRIDGGKVLSLEDMKKEIGYGNADVDFTDVPIKIEYHSPDVFDLNLVDLPGYITAVKEGQDKTLPKKIKSMCAKYLQDEQNMILCVVSAGADVATSVAVNQARKYDEGEDRTLGVLTKIDLSKPRVVRKILNNEEYRLPLGYIGVRCRTFDEIVDGVDFNQLIQIEGKFIKEKRMVDLPIGLPFLRQKLSDLLLHRIVSMFPEILRRIDLVIEDKTKNSDMLTQLYKHRDLERIARKLEQLINHFHVNSPSRMELEIECRQAIQKLLNDKFSAIDGAAGPIPFESELEQVTVKKDLPYDYQDYDITANIQYTHTLNEDVYLRNHLKENKPDNQTLMNDLLIYGENTPKHMNDEKLRKMNLNIKLNNIISRHLFPYISENYQIEKSEWHQKLNSTVENLADNQIGEESRQVVIKTLIDFVERLSQQKSKGDTDQQLAKFFFQYLISKINERTDYQLVAEQITFMLKRESRPQADFYNMMRKIWEYLDNHHIQLNEMDGWIIKGKNKYYKFPVFNQLWAHGYNQIMRDRMADDIYRIYAVNVINPLIFETLHNSLKLFKSGVIFREAKKQIAEQKKLEEIRGLIKDFGEQNPNFNPMMITSTFEQKKNLEQKKETVEQPVVTQTTETRTMSRRKKSKKDYDFSHFYQ